MEEVSDENASRENLVTEGEDRFNYLNDLSKEQLLNLKEEIKNDIEKITRQNKLYKAFLKTQSDSHDDEKADGTAETSEEKLYLLSDTQIYYLIHKKREEIEERLRENDHLRSKLEEVEFLTKEIKAARDDFYKNIIVYGKHPVTKTIIAEKVEKMFNESIRKNMTMVENYRMRIQRDRIQKRKILNDIKENEEFSGDVHKAEYETSKLELQDSFECLEKTTKNRNKLKARLNALRQILIEQKKLLQKECLDEEELQNNITKQEHLMESITSETAYYAKKSEDLGRTNYSISRDPQRYDLPNVRDYAKLKKENAEINRNFKKWKTKISITKLTKLLQ